MTTMANTIERITSNPVGRLMFKTVQPFVHAARHMAHPDLPNDHRMTRVSYRNREFSIRHRRWSLDDALAIRQCFEINQYDMPTGKQGELMSRFYKQILSSGRQPLILDCGANIGASIIWFAARYPEAHIIGIEPAPNNFELLRQNCTGIDVDLRQAAVSAEDGQTYFHDSGGHMGYRITTEKTALTVDMVSIATLLASKPSSHYAPFLLKIDIEGAEKNLFSGDCSLMNQFPLIILEPHDWLFPGQLCSHEFFRFHVAAGREFCMNQENIGSIALAVSQLDHATVSQNGNVH